MAFERVEVLILQCNQGMGNLIKIYAGGKLANLALIDLGTKSVNSEYVLAAVPTVILALESMATPRLDLLVVSHQDDDHWSLLPRLEAEIKLRWTPFKVGKFRLGGLGWDPDAVKVVTEFGLAFDAKPKYYGDNRSDYSDPNKIKLLAEFEKVYFRTLIVNVEIPRAAKRQRIDPDADSRTRNATSAVIVLEAAGKACVFPGDATVDTLKEINKIVRGYTKSPLVPCFALTVPHHGALPTLASNYRANATPRLSVAKEFAEKLKAERLVASAGVASQYKHPSKTTLETLAVKVSPFEPHTYVQFDNALKEWEEVNTADAICTTVLTLDDPPGLRTWQFTILPTGEIAVERITLSTGAPAPERLIALPADHRAGLPSGG
jgi:beta-lactamase superfamily II metal-dependent hydrolase